jgi:hypothetical protein
MGSPETRPSQPSGNLPAPVREANTSNSISVAGQLGISRPLFDGVTGETARSGENRFDLPIGEVFCQPQNEPLRLDLTKPPSVKTAEKKPEMLFLPRVDGGAEKPPPPSSENRLDRQQRPERSPERQASFFQKTKEGVQSLVNLAREKIDKLPPWVGQVGRVGLTMAPLLTTAFGAPDGGFFHTLGNNMDLINWASISAVSALYTFRTWKHFTKHVFVPGEERYIDGRDKSAIIPINKHWRSKRIPIGYLVKKYPWLKPIEPMTDLLNEKVLRNKIARHDDYPVMASVEPLDLLYRHPLMTAMRLGVVGGSLLINPALAGPGLLAVECLDKFYKELIEGRSIGLTSGSYLWIIFRKITPPNRDIISLDPQQLGGNVHSMELKSKESLVSTIAGLFGVDTGKLTYKYIGKDEKPQTVNFQLKGLGAFLNMIRAYRGLTPEMHGSGVVHGVHVDEVDVKLPIGHLWKRSLLKPIKAAWKRVAGVEFVSNTAPKGILPEQVTISDDFSQKLERRGPMVLKWCQEMIAAASAMEKVLIPETNVDAVFARNVRRGLAFFKFLYKTGEYPVFQRLETEGVIPNIAEMLACGPSDVNQLMDEKSKKWLAGLSVFGESFRKRWRAENDKRSEANEQPMTMMNFLLTDTDSWAFLSYLGGFNHMATPKWNRVLYDIIRMNLSLETMFPNVSYNPGIRETESKSVSRCHRNVIKARASFRLKKALERNKSWLLPAQLSANLLMPAVGTLVAGPEVGLAFGVGFAGVQVAGLFTARKMLLMEQSLHRLLMKPALRNSRMARGMRGVLAQLELSPEEIPESLGTIFRLANHLKHKQMITLDMYDDIKRFADVVRV